MALTKNTCEIDMSQDHIPKTLTEHNVQPGDVVQPDGPGGGAIWPRKPYTIQPDFSIIDGEGDSWGGAGDAFGYPECCDFTVLSRAARTQPAPAVDPSNPDRKTFGEMTDVEKGALLLAEHEGRVIECWQDCDSPEHWAKVLPNWKDNCAFRVKPEPKRETTLLHWKLGGWNTPDTHKITFDTIDGKPDCASIRMDELP